MSRRKSARAVASATIDPGESFAQPAPSTDFAAFEAAQLRHIADTFGAPYAQATQDMAKVQQSRARHFVRRVYDASGELAAAQQSAKS